MYKKMKPIIVGSGSSGKAIAKSLAIIKILHPDFECHEPLFLRREQNILEVKMSKSDFNILFIANPHGLHADLILKGETACFDMIFCEKPACVSMAEVEKLRSVKTPVFLFHSYRQTWAIQKLRALVESKVFGRLISIEGRYWQSSAAQRALLTEKSNNWKNDVKLSGPHDVLLDLCSHWSDLVFFLAGKKAKNASGFISYANSEYAHRDTHVHLNFEFEDGLRSVGSISKTVHGATNHLEVYIIGTHSSASWNFSSPDEIKFSQGSKTEILRRDSNLMGSQQSPFHGVGWLEGYVEIIRQGFLKLQGKEFVCPPTLGEGLDYLEKLLSIENN
jgi:predicted dehydrogenase